jgi:hypothetical protein
LDQKKNLEKSKKLISQYKRLFSTSDGKAVLHDLMLGHHYLNSSTFVPGDPYQSAKNEGSREVVIKIIAILKMDPEKLNEFVTEQEDMHV